MLFKCWPSVVHVLESGWTRTGRIDSMVKIDQIENIDKIDNIHKIDNMDQSPSGVFQVLVKCWSSAGQVVVMCWLMVGQGQVIPMVWI